MKHFKHLFFALIILGGMLSSCKKDAAVKSTRLSVGSDTTALVMAISSTGTIIYSGTVAPSASIGVIGDFYINLATSRLFGPKTASGWGNAIPLGSHIWSGSTVPTTATGLNGDFYLDKATFVLYGPRTSAGWGAGISLQGPPGTANVIYSDWITPTTYTKDTIFSTFHLFADIPASKITQAILDKGTVVVYGKLTGYNPVIWPATQVSALPIVITYQEGTQIYNDTWSALITLGNVRIQFTDDQNLYNTISNAHQFRYVIIPGAVHTTGSVNIKDYHQVQQAFHIPD
jgi:hypothetical protein